VIGELDMLVGSRYHSIVAALSLRIPPVVLGWAHKYPALMRLVALEEYVIDYRTIIKTVLLKTIKKAWMSRRIISEQLQERMPSVEHRVDRLFDEVAVVISNTKNSKRRVCSRKQSR
jgi:colanic acid/amylovoran biosynthesis protein